MTAIRKIWRRIQTSFKSVFGGRPKTKHFVLQDSKVFSEPEVFPVKQRRRGKPRWKRWAARPALSKWNNIPVVSVNTHIKVGRGGVWFYKGTAVPWPRDLLTRGGRHA